MVYDKYRGPGSTPQRSLAPAGYVSGPHAIVPQQRHSVTPWIVASALLLGLLATIYLSTRADDRTAAPPHQPGPAVERLVDREIAGPALGEPAPPSREPVTAPARLGIPVEPDCTRPVTTTSTLRGITTAQIGDVLREARGCAVLIEVWATWCPSCRASIPAVEAVSQHFGPQGLSVITLVTDDAQADVQRFFGQQRPQLHAIWVEPWRPGEFGAALGGLGATYENGIPYFALFDRRGALVTEFTGGGNLALLEDALPRALSQP